jgi:hypothetical protein
MFMFSDSQPAVSWSVLDHDRVPKTGYWAMAEACAPVIITADRPAASYRGGERIALDLHVVSDLRRALGSTEASAVLHWPGGGRGAWRFSGEVPADSCVRVGQIKQTLPDTVPPGPMVLELSLRWADGQAKNSYTTRVV